jgi:hypothetical protein
MTFKNWISEVIVDELENYRIFFVLDSLPFSIVKINR